MNEKISKNLEEILEILKDFSFFKEYEQNCEDEYLEIEYLYCLSSLSITDFVLDESCFFNRYIQRAGRSNEKVLIHYSNGICKVNKENNIVKTINNFSKKGWKVIQVNRTPINLPNESNSSFYQVFYLLKRKKNKKTYSKEELTKIYQNNFDTIVKKQTEKKSQAISTVREVQTTKQNNFQNLRKVFKDVQFLEQKSDRLKFFEFETVTIDNRGEEIKRELKQAHYFTETLSNNVLLDMVAIPGGSFVIGTEKEQHEVTIQPFFMGKYPITKAQWRAIAERTDLKVAYDLDPKLYSKLARSEDHSDFEVHPDSDLRPVEYISWVDAVEFCARLSNLTGKEYRLPSEAEWEYACRAGTQTPFYFGETITGELANYRASSTYASEPKGQYRKETTSVGQFPPNAFGLYDLHGNVWEWCADNWHRNYDKAAKNGNAWTDNNDNNYRVLRGGSWDSLPTNCHSACRSSNFWRGFIFGAIGFRAVCGGGSTV